ncbi:MAG: DUF5686 family protein [Bacteroidota bacterium]|nr:DUF5686 family protein [Bacteroidota bacterium]MDP4230748.1 DUF5686 family protein [Bacteroidota bacterium]
MRSSLILSFILLAFAYRAPAQTSSRVHLTGSVKSKETGEAIPRASIGILGTPQGTLANSDGRFSLALDSGKTYRLRIRALGHKPDTITVTLNSSQERTILLAVEPIVGKEITVAGDASRIEARRIMHEVIRRKAEWQAKLQDFQCTAYSRWNLRSLSGEDTTVQSVLESNAQCFWKKEKGFSEILTSRMQTANFPPEMNAFSVGDIVNFYDNRIAFNDFSFVGPVADDAFDSYDYDLIGTGTLNGASVYQIAVQPNLLAEAFDGTLWIDQTDYTIAYLDLSPSKAVKLGPIKDLHLQQTFELFDNNYYLPVDCRTNLSIKFQMPLVPQFKLELLSVLQNFSVNKGVSDTLFGSNRHRVAPRADSVDTLAWASQRAVPLAADEIKAYHTIDSTVSEARKDSSSGFSIFDILSFIDIPRYSQVEGWRFGLSKSITPVESFPLTLSGGVAYGLADKQWKYFAGLHQGILWTTKTNRLIQGDLSGGLTSKVVTKPIVLLAIDAKYFFDLSTLRSAYSSIENTIASVFDNSADLGYFYEKGFLAGLELTPNAGTSASLEYRHSQIWNAGTLQLIDTTNKKFRLGALTLGANKEIAIGKLNLNGSGEWEVSSNALASDYAYSLIQLQLSFKKRLGALGEAELTGRYSTLLAGALPFWHSLFFETRDAFFSKPSYFRGLDPFEFRGNRLWSLHLEHNFYDLPTQLLGIHFLDQFDLHWLFHAGIGQIEMIGARNFASATTADRPYSEIGMGIGNIFNILQIEGTWRLTHRRESNFYPTLSMQLSF